MEASILEQTKAQAQVLLPIYNELKSEFGEEKATSTMHQAMEKWGIETGKQINHMIPGNPVERIAIVTPYYAADNALDFEILKQTTEEFEYRVTRCQYAEHYKQLGEPELGYRFVCAHDFSIAAGISADLELDREHTIMQGDQFCHFCYKLKK
ncbi:L-2-amino-thiazoline-4-carboxylic acid hydrolase [bacterium]|nr:L-2-amino-thiazoline-4-carboxylic acid hydrolase [bacterium]